MAHAAETIIIGPSGWTYDQSDAERGAWVWLADRTCVQHCTGALVTAQGPMQLDLFAGAA
ncbi:hypothetical protein ACFVT1_36595 [Streptomyces sp. NPDC057963]|uniref:hypothetical protein n=1 Tax=Streptomyces sp. NPDC057963 TaxID=3346290 RepID=UPI0036ED12E6